MRHTGKLMAFRCHHESNSRESWYSIYTIREMRRGGSMIRTIRRSDVSLSLGRRLAEKLLAKHAPNDDGAGLFTGRLIHATAREDVA